MNNNDVFQVKHKVFPLDDTLSIRLKQNFEEIERVIKLLQIYQNKIGMALDEKLDEILTDGGNINTEYLEGKIRALQNEIEAGAGTVTITENSGIIITDDPVAPTKALRLLGGIFAIANEKDEQGNWIWRTFGTGDGFVADEIVSGTLRSGVVISDDVIVGNVQAGEIPSEEDIDNKIDEHNNQESPHLLPSYCKMSTDGFKVYDQYNNLRCHLGQYESGKYGLRIIDGIVEADTIVYDKTAVKINSIIDGFGGGYDGNFYSTGNVTFDVEAEDASTVVKQYESFTLNQGHVLTVSKRCRGLFIFCQGDVVINGTIDMNGKSAKVSKNSSAQRVLQVPVGVYVLDIPYGGKGGDGGYGGDGARSDAALIEPGVGGNKGYGTEGLWFGGGFGGAGGGGGSGENYNNETRDGGDAGDSDLDSPIGLGGGNDNYNGDYGGNFSGGGGARSAYSGDYTKGGGGGGGAGVYGGEGGNYNATDGESGGGIGGGLVCIVAKGNVTIGSYGKILCNGFDGGDGGRGGGDWYGSSSADITPGGGGGGQGGGGGGVIVIAYKGSYSNYGTLQVNGGIGGSGGPCGYPDEGYNNIEAEDGESGEAGTVGSIVIAKL